MARQIITLLKDDLDGGEADETVEFALDGIAYSIDLSEANAKDLRAVLARFVASGTRVGRVSASGQLSPGVPRRGVEHPNFKANRQLNNHIRDWAEKNGYDVAERGRISQEVVNAYHRGTPNPNRAQQPDVVAAQPPQSTAEADAPSPKKSASTTVRSTAKRVPAKASPRAAKVTT